MEVFISWSGARSQEVAHIFEKWLRRTVQACKPWISTKMEKGVRWSPEVASRLEESRVGIVCLTSENLEQPWILFEAGAIAKANNSRLCPFLLDLGKADVTGPLSEFQLTAFDKADVFALLETVNAQVDEERILPPDDLQYAFDKSWPELEQSLNAVKAKPGAARIATRTPAELLDETLDVVRGLHRQFQEFPEAVATAMRSTMQLEAAHQQDAIRRDVLYSALAARVGPLTALRESRTSAAEENQFLSAMGRTPNAERASRAPDATVVPPKPAKPE